MATERYHGKTILYDLIAKNVYCVVIQKIQQITMVDWDFLGTIVSFKKRSDVKCGHFDSYTSFVPAPLFLDSFSFDNSLEK